MAFINHFRNLSSRWRQSNETGCIHRNMFFFPQIFHSNTDAGFFKSHFICDIHWANYGELFAQYQNSFQIIFSRFIYMHFLISSLLKIQSAVVVFVTDNGIPIVSHDLSIALFFCFRNDYISHLIEKSLKFLKTIMVWNIILSSDYMVEAISYQRKKMEREGIKD